METTWKLFKKVMKHDRSKIMMRCFRLAEHSGMKMIKLQVSLPSRSCQTRWAFHLASLPLIPSSMSAVNTTGFSEDELSMLAVRRARKLSEQERQQALRKRAGGEGAATTANASNSLSAAFTRSFALLLGTFLCLSCRSRLCHNATV